MVIEGIYGSMCVIITTRTGKRFYFDVPFARARQKLTAAIARTLALPHPINDDWIIAVPLFRLWRRDASLERGEVGR